MVKKKKKDKRKAQKKKVAAKRTSRSRATRGSKKTSRKKAVSGKKAARGKAAVKRAPVQKAAVRKTSGKRKGLPVTDRNRARRSSAADSPWAQRGLGAEAGGQSGDTEGLSRAEIADSESVEELVEEGQAFEAAAISGVEDAPDADRGEVRTRQVPEDDVPEEYLPDTK